MLRLVKMCLETFSFRRHNLAIMEAASSLSLLSLFIPPKVASWCGRRLIAKLPRGLGMRRPLLTVVDNSPMQQAIRRLYPELSPSPSLLRVA